MLNPIRTRLWLPAAFASALALVPPQDESFASLTSQVFGSYSPPIPEQLTPASTAAAANAFLASLDAAQAERARLPLASDERANWTNVPPGADEAGIRLGDLDQEQLERACDLLATVLSAQGYAQTRDILLADDQLLRGGRPRVGFGAENFWLIVFGSPSADSPWALQLDGHHLAWNLAFDGDTLEMSPSFIGTQPGRYLRDGVEVVPMEGEVEGAFALLATLTDEQRAAALVSPTRRQLVSGPGTDGQVPEPIGIPVKDLDNSQQEALLALLGHYVGDLPEPHASRRMEVLREELDAMHFAWHGPTESPADVSYRVQGPSLIVEYACQDLGGNPLDHLHSMYRDPTNEYGAGLE